jgi:high-affinity Fe2+/Pb2+ permease
MFTSPFIAIIVGAIEFSVGGLISLAITSVVYRRFTDRSLALQAMILGGLAFILVMFLGGWAASHASSKTVASWTVEQLEARFGCATVFRRMMVS